MSKCIRCGEDIGETNKIFCDDCERDVGGDGQLSKDTDAIVGVFREACNGGQSL